MPFSFLHTYNIIQMPGPTMIFTTKIGAMGAAGAFAAAYVNTKLPNSNQDRTLRNQV
jgi:phosphoribosylcarboxyaminoimidazole (NCAIR) mutase